jgi:hypothetical protein
MPLLLLSQTFWRIPPERISRLFTVLAQISLFFMVVRIHGQEGAFKVKSQTVKTRTLQGPAEQPWRCKPVKVSLGDPNAPWHGPTRWECGHVASKQQVFYTTVEQGVSSEIYHNVNNVYGMAKSRRDAGSVKYIGVFSEVLLSGSHACACLRIAYKTVETSTWPDSSFQAHMHSHTKSFSNADESWYFHAHIHVYLLTYTQLHECERACVCDEPCYLHAYIHTHLLTYTQLHECKRALYMHVYIQAYLFTQIHRG